MEQTTIYAREWKQYFYFKYTLIPSYWTSTFYWRQQNKNHKFFYMFRKKLKENLTSLCTTPHNAHEIASLWFFKDVVSSYIAVVYALHDLKCMHNTLCHMERKGDGRYHSSATYWLLNLEFSYALTWTITICWNSPLLLLLLKGHVHVNLVTLGLSKMVGGCHGVKFMKIWVQNPMRYLRKLVLQDNALTYLNLDGIHQLFSQLPSFVGGYCEEM